MNFSRILNVFLILTGGFIAIYAQAREDQNQFILIAGIFMLMLGVYRISRNIPSKNDVENDSDANE